MEPLVKVSPSRERVGYRDQPQQGVEGSATCQDKPASWEQEEERRVYSSQRSHWNTNPHFTEEETEAQRCLVICPR